MELLGPLHSTDGSGMTVDQASPYFCDQFRVTIAADLLWAEREAKLNLDHFWPREPFTSWPSLESASDGNRHYLNATAASEGTKPWLQLSYLTNLKGYLTR